MENKLIEFNYNRYLRIVGTYHALNQEDRARLELLIDHAQFVALEWDSKRHEGASLCLMIDPFKEGVSYDGESHTLTSGGLNSLYLWAYMRSNEREIRRFNEGKRPDDPRDTNVSEFDFCYDLAQSKGKDVYLVDFSVPELLVALSSLSLRAKRDHLYSFFNRKKRPKAVDDIICRRREEHMLRRIEQEEGCSLEDLTRPGLLIVGTAHAKNYHHRIEEIKS